MGWMRYLPLSALTAVLLGVLGFILYERRRPTQHTTPSTQHTTPSTQHTTPSTQHTTPSTQHTTPTTQHTTPSTHQVSAKTLLTAYKVTVVTSVEECERFLQSRVPDPVGVVGLDCEWRGTSFNSSRQLLDEGGMEDGRGLVGDCPVALLQLAFINGEVLLVRLCEMEGVGERLREVLTNKSVLKFGVGIGNDIQRLSTAVGVVTVGCVDLHNIAVRCGIRDRTSLEGLTSQLLGMELSKTFHLRCGDWEAVELSPDQVDYAALDAIVALHILQELVSRKLSRRHLRSSSAGLSGGCTSSNPIGRSLEVWFRNEAHSSALLSLCQGVIDVGFKQSSRPRPSPSSEQLAKKTNAYSVRRSSLYHNCRLLAPDGQLLSTMHRKKLEWYLERGLGSLISDSPMTVQLTFEPAGRPGEDREYYLREKENICAVCGADRDCVRKNIVPHEYRRHFPSDLKEHISHDVLLLCVSCHQVASHHSGLLKQQIAAEHGLYGDVTSQKYTEDPQLRRVKNHARVLLKDIAKIPHERVKVLKNTVASFYGVNPGELTMEIIQEAADTDPRSLNDSYTSHSEKVVQGLLAEGGRERLFEFNKRWRQFFLDTMEPKYLPVCWSVEHNPK